MADSDESNGTAFSWVWSDSDSLTPPSKLLPDLSLSFTLELLVDSDTSVGMDADGDELVKE